MSVPADLAELQRLAAARGLGPVSVLSRTGSTNADLRVFARAGAVHGSVLVADAQDAGRGRLGRVWQSPPGENLYLSILLRPTLRFDRVPLLCLGAAAVIAEVAGTPLHIKWPNDLLSTDGRKVAGLLAEAEQRGGRLEWLVLGIGVNIRSAPADLPATHLADLGGQTDRTALALAILAGVQALPNQVATNPEGVLDRWRVHAAMLGKRVTVAGHEGTAVDVDADGALLLKERTGTRRVLAGDVQMVG